MLLVLLIIVARFSEAAFDPMALRMVLTDLGCKNSTCKLFDFVSNKATPPPCPLTNASYNNGALACNANGDVVHLVRNVAVCVGC
jgi:hypothetical protein